MQIKTTRYVTFYAEVCSPIPTLLRVCFFFLKSLLNLLQYCFCFMFWFFGPEAYGILAPQPGIEPAPPALEGEVLTTGPPGKSLRVFIMNRFEFWQMLFLHLLDRKSVV